MENPRLKREESLDLWICPHCLYFNPLIDTVCEYCQKITEENYLHIQVKPDKPKDDDRVPKDKNIAGPSKGRPNVKSWKCPHCEYISPVTTSFCKFCKNTTENNNPYIITTEASNNGNDAAVCNGNVPNVPGPSNRKPGCANNGNKNNKIEKPNPNTRKLTRSVSLILWKCPNCYYMNPIQLTTCEFCGIVTDDNTSYIPYYESRECGGIITIELNQNEADAAENNDDMVGGNVVPPDQGPRKALTRTISLDINFGSNYLDDKLNKKENANAEETFAEIERQEEIKTQMIKCPICQDRAVAVVVLKDCKHHYCRNCIIDYILHSPDLDVRCAVIDEERCGTYLQIGDIRDFLQEKFEEYLSTTIVKVKAEIANKERVFYCQTPDCPVWWIYDDSDCPDDPCLRNYVCPGCYKDNCLICQAVHEGQTCEEHNRHLQDQEDLQKTEELLLNLYLSGQGMACPKCGLPVMKDGGCDWGQCVSCKTEFCFATQLPRWGPGGRGDTSGGCRCNVNGVRCDPNCGNCH